MDIRKKEEIIKLIKFGIVGISNSIVYYIVNFTIIFLLKNYSVNWDYYLANILAFLLSVLWSFYWNNKAVFKIKNGEKRSLWRTLLKTYMAYAFTGIVLNNVLSWLWIDVLDISKLLIPIVGNINNQTTLSKYIAPLLNSIIGIPVNYVLNRFWAFRNKDVSEKYTEKDLK